MQTTTAVLTLGSPGFTSQPLSQTERELGAAAAWKQALQGTPLEAAAAARGHWAVGMQGEDGRVFAAVDRFATETLCLRSDDGHLRYARRADELAANKQDLDPQALFDYLYFHNIPAPRTIFRNVSRLPAGHCAWQDGSRVQVSRYWTPAFHEQETSFSAARARFLELLRHGVAAQLDGSTPACFLSGGTDSSTIAGLVAEISGKAPKTYSIGFEAEGYDEMEYARIAARHFKTEHHEHYITPADLVRLIPEVAADQDQPFGNSSALPSYFCALKAREDGVTRLLAGDGGDEIFGGNTRYAKQKVFAVYEGLPAGLRQVLLDPLGRTHQFDGIPLLSKGVSYIRQARVSMPERLQTYNLLERLGIHEVLTPGFLHQVSTSEPATQQRAVWQESQGAGFVNRMLAFDWRYTLAESDLPKVRGATALAGVSVGYPFLDQALVDFSTSLPSHYKLRRLKLRWFFKEALRGFLPDAILTKKKHGFGLPFGVWATRHDGLRKLAQDSVRGLGERGIVRPEFTRTLVERYLPEHPGYYGEMVWIMMMLEQWFRHHAPDYRLSA